MGYTHSFNGQTNFDGFLMRFDYELNQVYIKIMLNINLDVYLNSMVLS